MQGHEVFLEFSVGNLGRIVSRDGIDEGTKSIPRFSYLSTDVVDVLGDFFLHGWGSEGSYFG